MGRENRPVTDPAKTDTIRWTAGWGLNSKGKPNMSPQAGVVLVQEIAPRLRSAIPQCVRKVGAEDDEELLQDGLTMAAQMLDNLEMRGKQVTPGNVAYYCLLHLKSGRRSYSGGRTDVMGSATQLDHSSMMLSFEEEVGYDPELDEAIRLGDMLTCSGDDPSMAGARNLDWEGFIETHDYRYGVIVSGMAQGKTAKAMARDCGESYNCVRSLKERLADDLRGFMGDDAIADALRVPGWKGNILVDKEKMACRADRRRS